MIEVELRAKCPALIEHALSKIGAIQQGDSFEEDEYFKFEKDDQRKLVLRIRKKKGKELLTFKGSSKLPEDVAWQEWETPIEDSHNLRKLLLSNGLVLVVQIKKKRTSYSYEELTINIDEIENLGLFIEVECMTNDASAGKKTVEDFMHNKLHISPEAIVSKGYVPLMLEKLGR